MPTVKECIKELQNNYEPEDYLITHVWTMNDIDYALYEMEIELSTDEKRIIMDDIHYDIDPTVGITWDVVHNAITRFMEAKAEMDINNANN